MQTIAMNYKKRHPWMTEELRTQIKTQKCTIRRDIEKKEIKISKKNTIN